MVELAPFNVRNFRWVNFDRSSGQYDVRWIHFGRSIAKSCVDYCSKYDDKVRFCFTFGWNQSEIY